MTSRVTVAALALTVACTTAQRDFDDSSDGAAGDGAVSGAGTSAGGVANVAGAESSAGTGLVGGGGGGAGANGGASSGGTGAAGATGTGGSAGSSGEGNEAGAGGAPIECPKNSCCLATGVVPRDEVDPSNACQSCQPHRSAEDWSDRNGELCHSAVSEVFSPREVKHQSRVCGEGGCSDPYFVEPDAEQMLVITPTTDLDRLHLDFSNLRGSGSIGLTKAILRLSVKAVAMTQPVKIIVSGVAEPVCSYPISQKTYSNVTCDVTNAVKAWMQAPASTERTIAIATQNVGNPLMVHSDLAEDAALRPVLLLDYGASCEGDQCVNIERQP